MLEFDDLFGDDMDKFHDEVKKNEDLFDKARKIWSDPLVRDASIQFAKAMAVAVTVSFAKHATYAYLAYRDSKNAMDVDNTDDMN